MKEGVVEYKWEEVQIVWEISRFVEVGGVSLGRVLIFSSGILLVVGKHLYCFSDMKEKSLAIIKFNCAIEEHRST